MRLFVALDVPEQVRASISGLAAKLRPTCRNARWVRIEGAHVTLKFIGEVSSEKVAAIESALATVLFPAPLTIEFRGVGFFPNGRRPRVLWAGIEAGPELTALAAAVDSALGSLGIARETRAFSPHLTLARFDPLGRKGTLDALHAAIAKAGPFDFGNAVEKEFHLYLSVLKRGGAEYTRLATFYSEGSNPR
jgi:RNA 2',3'-cyclic 3'-phosphodiesterase